MFDCLFVCFVPLPPSSFPSFLLLFFGVFWGFFVFFWGGGGGWLSIRLPLLFSRFLIVDFLELLCQPCCRKVLGSFAIGNAVKALKVGCTHLTPARKCSGLNVTCALLLWTKDKLNLWTGTRPGQRLLRRQFMAGNKCRNLFYFIFIYFFWGGGEM